MDNLKTRRPKESKKDRFIAVYWLQSSRKQFSYPLFIDVSKKPLTVFTSQRVSTCTTRVQTVARGACGETRTIKNHEKEIHIDSQDPLCSFEYTKPEIPDTVFTFLLVSIKVDSCRILLLRRDFIVPIKYSTNTTKNALIPKY